MFNKKITALFLTLVMSMVTSIGAFAAPSGTEIEINIESSEAEVFIPSEMSPEEKQVYYESIEKQVELTSQKYGANFNKDLFRNELIFVLETDNSFKKIQSRDYNNIMPFAGTWIPDIKVKNDIAAAAINVAIDLALVSTGVGTVAAYVKKVGLKEARKLFTSTLTTKLKAWGLGALAVSLPVAVDFVFNLLNPGAKIAEYLDSVDSYPNNGYLDIIL